MPSARRLKCQLIQREWITPSVMRIRFEPSKRFEFEPGQFVSLVVPHSGSRRSVRRAYSLATPDARSGYELCIKLVPEGLGSCHFAALKPGQPFEIYAPYGDFVYEPSDAKAVCFISTGTGIAPFLSMARSDVFHEHRPERVTSLFGAYSQEDIIYPGLMKDLHIEEVVALSRPAPGWEGFTGRVTDYLKSLPKDWGWKSTDFYLCGNGNMVEDAVRILEAMGVPEARIRKEVFFTNPNQRVAIPLKKAA